MKKIVKQDGKKKVYILEDGSELPFDKVKNGIALPEIDEPKKKKKFFKKDEDSEIKD